MEWRRGEGGEGDELCSGTVALDSGSFGAGFARGDGQSGRVDGGRHGSMSE